MNREGTSDFLSIEHQLGTYINHVHITRVFVKLLARIRNPACLWNRTNLIGLFRVKEH